MDSVPAFLIYGHLLTRLLYGVAPYLVAVVTVLTPLVVGCAYAARPASHDYHAQLVTYTSEWLAVDPALNPERAVPLLALNGRPLGPKLDDVSFCELAARGAAVVEGATYRVVGTAREPQVFCGRYFSRLHRKQPVGAGALSRSRFERIDWPHGVGVLDYKLEPWRTVAADRLRFAPGTLLLLDALIGRELVAGQPHDGLVMVTDSVEEARGDTLAVYAGVQTAAKSQSDKSMPSLPAVTQLRIVRDPVIIARWHARLRIRD